MPWELVTDVARERARMTRQAFVDAFAFPFLLRGAEAGERKPMSFKTASTYATTGVFDVSGQLRGDARPADFVRTDPGAYCVHRLAKSDASPWQGRISVGRAANNDVVLQQESVSKLHAYFFHQAGAWHVRDNGSANGTRINGHRLAAAAIVRSGDVLEFGGVLCQLLGPAQLYELLPT